METIPPGFDHRDAMLLGLAKAVQALAAVTYHTSPKRDALEKQLQIYLEASNFEGQLLKAYKSPIAGALQVIDEIKAAQPKE